MEQIVMNSKKFLEEHLRIGARKTTRSPLTRPSAFEGIEGYLFLMIFTKDIKGQAAKPEQLKEMMEESGMDEDTAWRIAERNTKETAQAIPMKDIEAIADLHEYTEDSVPMFVITNKERMYGAGVALLNSGEYLKSLGWATAVVLPSSRHEMIIAPAPRGGKDMPAFNRMVWETNREVVQEEDRLTDRAYLIAPTPGEMFVCI